jgi:prolyl oligopeptidase
MRLRSLGWFLMSATPWSTLASQGPPRARAGDHVATHHGVRVPDPYQWLESLDAPETREWVRAQDAFARTVVGSVPGREMLDARVRRAATVVRYSAPQPAGDRAFYTTFVTGGGPAAIQAVWMRTASGGEPRGVLDGATLGDGLHLGAVRPSPDGRLLAYLVTSTGSNWGTLRIRDVENGHDLADSLTGLNRARSGFVWTSHGLAYDRFTLPPRGAERTTPLGDESVWLHRIGESQELDRRLYAGPAGASWTLSAVPTRDRRRIVVAAKEPNRAGDRVVVIDLDGGPARTVVPEPEAAFTYLGDRDGWLWFQTDADAPNGRVVAIDPARPARAQWRELVPEGPHPITNWLGVSTVGDHFLVGYLEDARHVVRVFDARGRFRYTVDLPSENGSLWTGFVGEQTGPEAYYIVSGLVDPGTVYRLDVHTGRSERVLRPALDWNPDDFVTEQVFYPARDGTRVPMFLVRHRGSEGAGPAPVLMYGYAYDWAAAPWYQPQMVAWLEMGGVWALPNIRGGTEYGEPWNAAGSRHHKQTAIDDYVDAARWLVREGYTTARLMVANASSAGGVVAGAAVNQHPESFGALVLDYPLLDMLRYHRFTGARAWQHEYGTVDDPEDFAALRAYSPVHTVRPGRCYPPTLVAPGELDETTPPLHAYKYVAALQAAQACDHPVLLRVAWGAGHAAGKTPADAVEMWVDQLAFLTAELVLPSADARDPTSARGGESQSSLR